MKQINTKNRLLVGALGEEIACRFLMKHNFTVIERNFRQKCGEIDIVAEKMGEIHFVEVKTVSRESGHRPEENMHFRKIQRLERTIQLYLSKRHVPCETRFQIDGVTVCLDPENQRASVGMIENINF